MMELPAFGMPGRMLATGRVDDDGYLRENPSEPAWNVLRVSGPLDLPRLAAAVDVVTRATDSLRLRLRNTDHGPRFVWGENLRIVLEAFDTESPIAGGRMAAEVAAKLAPLLFDKIDLRHQPAGRVCVVHGDHDEHLLALSFDHSVLDGWSLGLLTRAIAQCYRTGEYEPRGQSFSAFVQSQPGTEVQDASLARWKSLLAEHPIPGPDLRFPGGTNKSSFQINGYYDATYPEAMASDLTAAVAATGLSRAELLTAATALAVTTWSDGPQPMLSVRHGHARPEDVLVIGPLVETYVVLSPGSAPSTVAGWLAAHRATNRDTPPLYGRSIREVVPFAPRNAALNVVPPARPLTFGPSTRAVTASRDFVAPLWTGDRPVVPSTAAFWVNFFQDLPGRVEISITYDREVLPAPELLADSVWMVVRSASDGSR